MARRGNFLEKGRLLFHMGSTCSLDWGMPVRPKHRGGELTALRLMANGSRMEMLHAMAERPMSGQSWPRS